MNPAFYILVLLAAFLLWLILSFMYKPLGKFAHRLWKDAKDAMNEEDKEESKKE